ncbi:MAG: hypothetical protein ACYDBH_14510 [Acidobacteriaceae bacterium]
MNAYLCTYRQITPPRSALKKMELAAKQNSLLRRFLDGYEGSFFDWGDDPSFFAAKHMLGDVRRATWGVCRRDVRSNLEKGDIVVFFCARQNKEKRLWRYYFIGFGAVREVVRCRELLWTSHVYAPYRKFYNVLTASDGKQRETFYPFHKDWERRAEAPYVLFDAARSAFNLDSPHHVATWDSEANHEAWRGDPRTSKIEQLLFVDRGIERRLRTSRTGYAHVKLNLLLDGKTIRPGLGLSDLTRALGQLV